MKFTSVLQHFSLFTMFVFCLIACQSEQEPASASVFETDSGSIIDFSNPRESWLVVNYWAEWCKPCIEEIPELNELNKEEDITVFGINYDGATGQVLSEQISKLKVEFPTLQSDLANYYQYERPNVLPTTLIINPKNQLVGTLVGPQTRLEIIEKIKSLKAN